MKPLYDRYRLVKQILCRASTIPVIVSITLFTSLPISCPIVLLLYGRGATEVRGGDLILRSLWL